MPRSRSRSFSRTPSRSPSPTRSRSRSRSRSATYSRSPSPAPSNPMADKCPFLIRVFVLRNKHNPVIEYDQKRFPEEEYWVYAWKHSTPSSIVKQLYAKLPPMYRSAIRFSVRHVYVDADEERLYRAKDLVSFTPAQLRSTLHPTPSSNPSSDAADPEERRERLLDQQLDDAEEGPRESIKEKTLDEYGFLSGDLLSLCVALPRPKGGAGTQGAPRPQAGFERGPAGGGWGRGEPLPPQNFGGRGRGGRLDRGPDRESWKRARSRSPPPRGDSWRR